MTLDALDELLFSIECWVDDGKNPRALFMRFRDELENFHYALLRGLDPRTDHEAVSMLQKMQQTIEASRSGQTGQKMKRFREALSYGRLTLDYARTREKIYA